MSVAVHARRCGRKICRYGSKCLSCILDAFDVLTKILGPCLICLANGLFGFVTYSFFAYVLPTLDFAGLLGQVVVASLGIFLVTNMYYNYLKAICMDAGTPPKWEDKDNENDKESLSAEEDESAGEKTKQCHKCTPSRVKPPRAHHCSVCRKCVMKMDHHCPWINNCVGVRNYRNFCLFLLYLNMCCIFVMATFFNLFFESVANPRHSHLNFNARQYVSLSFVISGSIFLATCILGGFHVFLVLTNQTTIEFQSNMFARREAKAKGVYFRNPYDLGRSRNFQQVFGPNPFCRFRWMLSWSAPGPTGTGLKFPTLSQLRL